MLEKIAYMLNQIRSSGKGVKDEVTERKFM